MGQLLILLKLLMNLINILSAYDEYLVENTNCQLIFNLVNEEMVAKIINQLKISHVMGMMVSAIFLLNSHNSV